MRAGTEAGMRAGTEAGMRAGTEAGPYGFDGPPACAAGRDP